MAASQPAPAESEAVHGSNGSRSAVVTAALAGGHRRAGVSPEVVSKRLGHASVAIPLGIYEHVMERDDKAAAELTAAAIDG